jgi:hypothetical protein
MPDDPTPPPTASAPNEAATSARDDRPAEPGPTVDRDLRRMLTWVFGALILTVLFSILVVEVTLRWFEP